MKVKFSPKYKPLFQLLKAREIYQGENFKNLPPEKQQFWEEMANVHTVIISGGRDAGKSFALSSFNVIASHDYGHRILYTRQTMSSTDNSITEALEQRMELFNYRSDYEHSSGTYYLKGEEEHAKITITGQKTASGNLTAKLKSIENYSIFETDEAEETEGYEQFKKIKRSLRPQDVQALSILAFNPPTREHWIYQTFFKEAGVQEGFNGIKNDVLYIHATYLDNIKYVTEHNLKDYEGLRLAHVAYNSLSPLEKDNAPAKLKRQAEEYEHVALGAFRNTAEGVIFNNWELGPFDYSLPLMGFGLDFGFDDPDVLVRCAVDLQKEIIYLKQELFQNGLGVNELADIILNRVGYKNLVIGDSAHPRLIKQIRERGVNIEKARKGAGSVLRAIKTLKSFTIIIDPESTDMIEGFSNYVWHDKRAEVPRNEYKHFPDAAGYIAVELILF